MLLTAIRKASNTHNRGDDIQRRRDRGGFHEKIMMKLQRVDIETWFGASSHSHPDRIRSQEVMG